MANTHIIRTDRAYAAMNGYPEALGDPVGLIAAIMRRTPRLDRPACLDYDPDLWFADGGAELAAARSICGSCPAIDSCRNAAESASEEWGVWAGKDRTKRHRSTSTHCKNGHEWTEESIRWRKTKAGRDYRECRECTRDRQRAKQAA